MRFSIGGVDAGDGLPLVVSPSFFFTLILRRPDTIIAIWTSSVDAVDWGGERVLSGECIIGVVVVVVVVWREGRNVKKKESKREKKGTVTRETASTCALRRHKIDQRHNPEQ